MYYQYVGLYIYVTEAMVIISLKVATARCLKTNKIST